MEAQKMQLIMNLICFICTMLGFSYGGFKFFRRKKALYLQMIVCALGCMMLGRLYQVLLLITSGSIPNGFHMGKLAVIGSFLFFFSANYGQMDSLGDDGSRALRKYRLVALVAPLVILLGLIPIWMHTNSVEIRVVAAIQVVVIMMTSYFNLKHLIMPDVELGIIASIRGYNFLALLFAVLSMAEMTVTPDGFKLPSVLICAASGLVALLLVPVLESGVKKWTI